MASSSSWTSAGWAVILILLVVGPAFVADRGAATIGGPDSYGYIWVDSRSPSPVVQYNWIDIASSGIRLLLSDDDCTFEVSLGFQFRYYGTISESIFVCSNGFITFGVPDSFYPLPPIPDPATPNDRIVALGLDLNPAAGGGVYVLSQAVTTPRRFIITWLGVYEAFTAQPETFQIVLEQNETTKDGRIRFQYQSLLGVSSPLVGIENAGGTSGLAYPQPLEDNLAVQFLPPSDAQLPPDTLRVIGTSLAPPTVSQGATNVPIMQVDLSTLANDVQLLGLQVTLSGLGAGAEDVPTIRLWLDDGDGTFSTVTDGLVATVRPAGVPAVAALRLTSPVAVANGGPRRLFVTYNVASGAGVGDWIGARLASPSSVLVAFPDLVDSTGFPFDTYVANTRTRIDASQDILQLAQAMPLAPSQAAQWATDVPMISLRLDADQNNVILEGLRVALGGNASLTDVWAVKVLRDRDADGNYTPGTDDVLAIASPAGAPPTATLPFSLTVAAGTPERLLVVLDVMPNATLGHILNMSLDEADFILPGGSSDLIDPMNFPAVAGNTTVVAGNRPTLRLPWVDVPPVADGFWRSDEYLLGPQHTVSLDRPAGNGVLGYVTAQNNASVLFVAVDVLDDLAADSPDGITIAFDTDGDGQPTAGADDLFVANASGGARNVYNASASAWNVVGPCDPWAGNPSVPSCVVGRGSTTIRALSHGFYEFQIPLAAFGVPDPIPLGTTIRFALAGEPHLGLTDGGNRSTWPLVFGPSPPLAFYGDLALATGPVPNLPPYLDWAGTPGYGTDGIDPDAGVATDAFVYKIVYFDSDDDPPAIRQPVLQLMEGGVEIADSPFPMEAEDPGDANHVDGKTYLFAPSGMSCGGNYSYLFTVTDARGKQNATSVLSGPQIACPNRPPTLSGESVSPTVANAGSVFAYRVAFGDQEGTPPALVEVEIRQGGMAVANTSLLLAGWVGAPGDFVTGAFYSESAVLAMPGNNYTFRFRATDGDLTTETSWFFGPIVLVPPPDVLVVAGVDLAPLVIDEGSQRVPFLRLQVLTSDQEVNVTSLRVDRVGSAGDLEVQRILLYNDLDRSGTVNGGDVLLGSRPPLLGSATFPLSLRVTPAEPAYLIFLIDLTRPGTADATVGLEVRNETYVSVGPGDVVQSFPSLRSTRALVNVAPAAANPQVDGRAAGTAGILHIVTDFPALSWQYTDPNSADLAQTAYNVSVWSAAPLALLWDRNESGPPGSAAYAGPPLVDGRSYFLQVSVFDGRLWSPPSEVLFRMNTPPPVPVPLAPADLATGVDPNATLLWMSLMDADGDGITYFYWVSDDPGFASTIRGSTTGSGVPLALASGTTYYWKVATSDGYEFAGNATVWRFTTKTEIPPVRGEIRGRVVSGTTPLPDAFLQLLVDGSVIAGGITGSNGTFAFRDLDLRAYTVRVSAAGYQTRTVAAEPTEVVPVIDLQDIALEPTSGGGGGTDARVDFPWIVLILGAVLSAALSSLITVVVLRRRKAKEERQEPAIGSETATASQTATALETAAFECPECGRRVTADAATCVCGAVFE